LVRVKREHKAITQDAGIWYQKIKDVKVVHSRRQKKVAEVHYVKQCLEKEVTDRTEAQSQTGILKDSLLAELETEKRLIANISAIALKYKKLLIEQTREKEKMALQVKNSKKVLANLE